VATDLERLVVSLEANIAKYEKSLAKAMGQTNAAARGIEDRFNKINPKFDGMFNSFNRGLIGAVAGGFALEQVIQKIRTSIGEVDDLGDMSERVGLSTDAIQALRHTLGQAGGDASLADKAFDKFSDSVAEAALGSGYLMKVFNANGVALRNSAGTLRDNNDLLVDFARLVTNAETPQERLKLATDAFGRQAGPKMVGMLKEIAEQGLPALIQKAKEAGVVLDQGLIDKAGELDKAFRKVEERAATAFKQFAVDWGGPALLETFRGLEIAVKNFALSFDLLASGRVREALGIVSRFEGAKQRIAIGLGNQLTPDAAGQFYDAVGINKPPTRVEITGKKTKLPSAAEDSASRDAFQREVEQTQKRIAVTNVETETIDLNTYARERARKVVELETAAKAANKQAGLDATKVTAEQRVQIDALADAYAKSKVAAEAAHSPLRAFAREARDVDKALQDATLGGIRSFEDALVDIVTGTESVADAFKKMASAIIADLARIAIRQAITGPIAAALGGGSGGFNLGSLFGGARAAGGPVEAGRAYVVGEKRPELFVPNRSGMILPRVATAGGGGSTFAPVYQINAAGADSGTVARIQSVLAAHARAIAGNGKAMISAQRMQSTGVG